jgi:2-polyprenyl-6-methoxyphenol hydroxylase-like FAD-dependent oxidoreductase
MPQLQNQDIIPRIAIIGAGPGGCMLARLLHNQNIPCTIFESEVSIDYRTQGGSLDLRAKTGLAAIREAGLWNEFQRYARYDGESLLVTDKNLTTWARRSPGTPDQGRRFQEAPEIDRSHLRKILLESVPTESIRWGMKLTHLQEEDLGLELHFANGQVECGYSLIVGCDGAFSKTRALLTPDKPYYTGLAGWETQIPNAKKTAPAIYNLVNRGSVFAFSDGKSLSIQQLSSGNIRLSTYTQHPENFSRSLKIDCADLTVVKRALGVQYNDWAPELQTAFTYTQGSAIWRQLYMLPVGFTWPHKEGVTLLGDAAHLMSPFSGIGVNTAFHDALLLSRQIVRFVKLRSSKSLDKFIVDYENEMFHFAHKAQKHTEGSMNDMLFTPGAPRTSIESWILRHVKEDLPAWSHPLLSAIVYGGYWVYKLFV